MNDINAMIIILSISLTILIVDFVISSFSYQFINDTLIMRWKILKYIPFGTRKVKFLNIREVRRFNRKNDLSGGDIFGNVFTKRIVVIVLKNGRFFRKILITPDEPDFFIEQINKLVDNIINKTT